MIFSIIEKVLKANNYLWNAHAIMLHETAVATQNFLKKKDEQQQAEQSIAKQYNKQINDVDARMQKLIKQDQEYLTQIKDLNRKLIDVDKKYAKVEKSLNNVGLNDYLRSELHKIIDCDNNSSDIKIVDKLFRYFKDKSYKYLTKPVPGWMILSKKRRRLYEYLSACTLLIEEYVDLNINLYQEISNEEINKIKAEQAAKLFEIQKKYNKELETISENISDDKNFLMEESNRALSKIFDDNFFNTYNIIKMRSFQCFNDIYEDSSFYNDIYVGDIAWQIDTNILNTPICQKFIKEHSAIFEDGTAFLPWTMSLSECQSIIIEQNSIKDKEDAVLFINRYIYSFIRQLPVNGVELTIFDSECRGNSILSFLNFFTVMPEMFSKKIFTSGEDILKRLKELNQYVDSVIQQKLLNKYKNAFEYNIATPENPLTVKIVCVFDFPKSFDDKAYEYLLSIIKNAKNCGIFVIICHSKNEARHEICYGNWDSLITEIKTKSISLIQVNGILKLENYGLAILPIEMPEQKLIDEYCSRYEAVSKNKMSQGVPFISIVKDGDYFVQSSVDSIKLPVGKGDGSATQYIEFGKRSSQHAIITGATGSGKSTLLHTIIMSSLINYSPDELILYLMDFKSGTEFKIYESIPVPHIKLLALDALQEFGESILMELVEEQIRRSKLFKENGECTNIKSFIKATGIKMPRILVVMDEFQILFNENSNRKVAIHCAELANKIVTEGRAFGIHLIMATQSLRSIREKTALSNSTIEQMRIRIGLKCGEEDATYIFGDINAQDALMKMKGAIGTAVYNPEYTESSNYGFRVAYCSEDNQKELLSYISNELKDKFEANLKIFEGGRVPEYPIALIEAYKNNISNEIVIAIGEPIRIDLPIEIKFNKKKNNNLLIVGSDAILMSQILSNIIFGVANYHNTLLHYIDGNLFFNEDIDPQLDSLLADSDNMDLIKSRKDCLLFIEKIYKEFKQRKKSNCVSFKRHIVVFNGVQFIDIISMMLKGDYINRDDYIPADTVVSDDLTKDEGELNFNLLDLIDYSVAIKELIEFGYAYGIYFIITFNEYQSVKELLHYGAGLLNKFTNRIVFSISDKDCDDLIEGVQVSGLNNITAIYTDGIKNTLQFKPYALKNYKLKEKKQ